jgi:hypothetical protein
MMDSITLDTCMGIAVSSKISLQSVRNEKIITASNAKIPSFLI